MSAVRIPPVLRASAGGNKQVDVSGASPFDLIIGTVLPPGATVQSATLDGQPATYQLVTTNRGTQVEVAVPRPGSQESLVVTFG